MRNIKLTIEYDGSRYQGWTRLGKDESGNTISNKITEVLKKMTEEEKYMKEALRQARKAEKLGEVPIGCVIVKDGKIIARGYNRRNTDKNTLAHADCQLPDILFYQHTEHQTLSEPLSSDGYCDHRSGRSAGTFPRTAQCYIQDLCIPHDY